MLEVLLAGGAFILITDHRWRTQPGRRCRLCCWPDAGTNENIAGEAYVRVSQIKMHKMQCCPRSKAGHKEIRRPGIPYGKQLYSLHSLTLDLHISALHCCCCDVLLCRTPCVTSHCISRKKERADFRGVVDGVDDRPHDGVCRGV